ncbi:NAD(P)-dependent dehydrogenase, short-chain alcohol dehydrogenase family [Promicromonospora umidemergens]|uniref:SDR family oxidoreductase n=1 Tax=Promicromonospora umidemergens TaxID=629679 RepID=A0ABP8XY34_9MICO|nr:SDR family NAD(P)-dependent oxidoreductase [Promicromonospora umidemergens]MCP2284177.1 NAD(P)-dependent dehydrogenase, short-chain alcohol dehydrogenase family [Promicromonospora umidemergens]
MTTKTRTVVVTGSAAGIGQHIAADFARSGARLVLADVQPVDETLTLVQAAGAEAHHVHCDITDEGSVRSFGERVAEICGGSLDVLVNNAGINGEAQLVQDMPLASWQRTIATNLTGTMLVTRELIPLLAADGGGQIVNIASNVARRGLPYRADYVASKWALLGLTQTLALELVEDGIRVNAVCPGPVEVDRIEKVMQSHAEAEGRPVEDVRREWEAGSPMGRFIEPGEVAAVVSFLASDESSAMTGQALNVTGGQIMT